MSDDIISVAWPMTQMPDDQPTDENAIVSEMFRIDGPSNATITRTPSDPSGGYVRRLRIDVNRQ